MTDGDIVDGVLEREGPGDAARGYVDARDAGGRTAWGISERANPDLWQPGPPTREQARARYYARYVAPFDFITHAAVDDRLRVQAIDFGVNSGVETAIKALQRVLDVADDGQAGAATVAALARASWRHVNNELCLERIKIEEDDIARRPADRAFEHGWLVRVLLFYVSKTGGL